MSHLDIRHVVQGEIVSDDTALLDSIESNLPDTDANGNPKTVTAGAEFTYSRTSDGPDLADNEERIVARMTFAADGTEFIEDSGTVYRVVDSNPGPDEKERGNVNTGNIFGPQTAAVNLYNAVKNHDLANKASNWTLQCYRSPEGAVLAEDVEAWYEANPDEKPTDEDGNEYIPSTWNPENHVEKEVTK